MVFGDVKTGKTTLIERLKRKRLRVGKIPPQNNGISIKQWIYPPSSSDNAVKFMIWEFDNQVKLFKSSIPLTRVTVFRIFVKQHITVSIHNEHCI